MASLDLYLQIVDLTLQVIVLAIILYFALRDLSG